MKTEKSQSRGFKNDLILIAAVLVFALIGFALLLFFNKEGDFVVIKVDGVETACYNLSDNIEVELVSGENESFSNLLVIKDGKAYIETANCPDKVCVGHRPINKSGQTIVCLPHKTVISIEKADKKAPDIVV